LFHNIHSREGLNNEGFLGNKKRPTKPSITLYYSSRLYVHYSRTAPKSQAPEKGPKRAQFGTKMEQLLDHYLARNCPEEDKEVSG